MTLEALRSEILEAIEVIEKSIRENEQKIIEYKYLINGFCAINQSNIEQIKALEAKLQFVEEGAAL